jgi:peptidoglycan/xylan/chitin deacetylase (PgdA/CDA1 family)
VSGAVILMYHVIDEPRAREEAGLCCPPQRFAQHMQMLRERDYRIVGLNAFLQALDDESAALDDLVAVTFDDAFECTCRNALPILAQHGIPATVFVPSDHVGGTNTWMHTRGLPRRGIASYAQLAEIIAAGVEIGSHARTHARLAGLESGSLRDEIRGSREALEARLGRRVDYFAYPYGINDANTRNEVALAGYRAACGTRSGFNRRDEDRFALRRIDVHGSDSASRLRRKIQFGTNDIPPLFLPRYLAGRVAARFERAVRR